MPVIQTVLNYNRAQLGNMVLSSSNLLLATPTLLLEYGLFVPAGTAFIKILSTVGWIASTIPPEPPDQPLLLLELFQDGELVASASQESISDGPDSALEMLTTFQAILAGVPVGHHVYQLFATNAETSNGDITVTGPVNSDATAIGTP